MEIVNNRIEEPGDYFINSEQQVIVIRDTENVNIFGEGIFMNGSGFNNPNIRLRNSKNITVRGIGPYGLVMHTTRIMCQEYSSNLTVENVIFVNSHGSCISAHTERHIDAKSYPQIEYTDFEPEYVHIKNVIAINPSEEFCYIGGNKEDYHYTKEVIIENLKTQGNGREGNQFSHVKNLYIDRIQSYKTGQKRIKYQTNGLQIMDCNGIIKNAVIDHTNENGIIIKSHGITFVRPKISNCPENAVFIGEPSKLWPNSPLLNNKSQVYIEPEISNCKYAFNIQTDVNVKIYNPKLSNVERLFHPRSSQANVEIIYEPMLKSA